MTDLNPEGLEKAARELFEEDANVADVEWPEWDSPENIGKPVYIENARAAVTAYLEAQTVTTVEELDALPVGSVVLDRVDCCYRLYHDLANGPEPVWCIVGEEFPSSPHGWLPATVLYRPAP